MIALAAGGGKLYCRLDKAWMGWHPFPTAHCSCRQLQAGFERLDVMLMKTNLNALRSKILTAGVFTALLFSGSATFAGSGPFADIVNKRPKVTPLLQRESIA